MAAVFLRLVSLLFTLYSLAVLLRSFLPWFGVNQYHPVMRFLISITEPLLAPLRRYVPPLNNLDFTPMVLLIILWVVEWVLRILVMALF